MNQVTHDNHYVPKVYLKQWSDDSLHVWAYRLLVSNENVPEWQHRSMDKTAFLRDLYTEIENGEEIDEFEKWLEFEFENPVQKSIRKVLKDNPLSSRDWELLASFLGAQDTRTPQSYLESTERWERTLPDLMQKTLDNSVRKLEDEEFRKNIEVSSNDESSLFNGVLEINVVKSSEQKMDRVIFKHNNNWKKTRLHSPRKIDEKAQSIERTKMVHCPSCSRFTMVYK